jgi:hypothetical protein
VFTPWALASFWTKLSVGGNDATYFRKGLAAELDPVEQAKWREALDKSLAAHMAGAGSGASTGLAVLGLATGNPGLLMAGASGMSGASTGTTTGQVAAVTGVQSYVDQRVKIGIVVFAVVLVGVLFVFLRRRKR